MSRIDEALRQAGLKPMTTAAAEFAQPDAGEPLPTETVVGVTAPSPAIQLEQLPPQLRVSKPTAGIRFIPDEKLIVHPAASRASIERYRRVAATLHHLQEERGVKVLMVASAAMGEGKTLTAANVALTLSESYRRKVLLIDADLRRPSLTATFQLQRSKGLSERLRGESNGPLGVLEMSDSLALLPGGKPDSDPMAGLTSGRMRQIIQQASAAYDWVIIDTPPLTLQPDAGLLGAMAEAVLLVVCVGIAPAASVEAAVEAVGREKVVGVVLNRVDEDASEEAAYYEYFANAKKLTPNAQTISSLKP